MDATLESTLGLGSSLAMNETSRQSLRQSLETYLAREALAERNAVAAWDELALERTNLAASEAKRKHEAEQHRRLAALALREREARAAADRAASAGLEAKGAALQTFESTLEASFAKLGAEETRVASAAEALRAREDATQRRLGELAAADAEQKAAADWLKREVSRADADAKALKLALAEREARVAAREDAAEAAAAEAAALTNTLDRREAAVADREAAVAGRETDAASLKQEIERQSEDLARAIAEAAARADEHKALSSDVDARAHSVAAADVLARERLEALTKRAEALALARDEVERLARAADGRVAAAEEAERSARVVEERSAAERVRAEAATAEADAMHRRAEEALAKALREARDKDAAAAAAREKARADAERKRLEADAEAKQRREAELKAAHTCRVGLEAALAKSREKLEEERKQAAIDAEKERHRLALLTDDADAMRKEMATEFADREAALKAREDALLAAEAQLEASLAARAANEPPPLPPPSPDKRVSAREKALEQRLAAAEDALALKAAAEGARARALASRHPWLLARPGHGEMDAVAWAKAVGDALAKSQLAAHEATRAAHRSVLAVAAPQADSGGEGLWALLPRDVRQTLRDGVALGDASRRTLADLQGSLVRTFLRRCASPHETPNDDLADLLRVVRGAASREVVRRKALVAALKAARYAGAALQPLLRVANRSPSEDVQRTLFKLKQNRFDALRLRTPAAKARFAAASATWAAPEFKRFVHALAARFNGSASTDAPDLGASSLEKGVFFGFEDAALADSEPPRVELRFDDDGDDGGHANRCALVFDDPQLLADCFAHLERDRAHGVAAVVNGFLPADEAPSAEHEVAVALDLLRQGILCDVRLRLRALERPQRHLGSLAFLADASSHEEILLPLWSDVAHADGWACRVAELDAKPPHSQSLGKPIKMRRDYTHPPNWGHTV